MNSVIQSITEYSLENRF